MRRIYSRGDFETVNYTVDQIDDHLDPAAVIAFYGTLQKSEQDHAGPPDFLSTHPDMSQRLTTLLALAGPPPTDARRLLSEEDWTDIRSLCRLQTARRSSPDSADLP